MTHQRKKDRVLESLSQSSIVVKSIHWQAQAPVSHSLIHNSAYSHSRKGNWKLSRTKKLKQFTTVTCCLLSAVS